MQVTIGGARVGPPPNRSADRRVALLAIALAAGYLISALASLVLPAADRHGLWLPLHLVLAGAATSAIAGVLPFFVAAFAAAQPAHRAIRVGGVLAVASGAAAISAGVALNVPAVAVAGGLSFITGIVLTTVSAVLPLRRALGPGRGPIVRAYLAAMAFVVVGATLATLLLAGSRPIVEAWARLKPAHAWLNLVGFVSLVIATTLLHFYPTAIGARISGHWSGRVTILGTALGAALVATGYAIAFDLVARAGAVATIAGAIGLVLWIADRWRSRARWTTDAEWHRFVIGGLTSSVAWYVVGVGIASVRVLIMGADPLGWGIETVAVPLVGGWAALAVLASASHLLPSVGPGDQAAHAGQRRMLGIGGSLRLVVLDAGLVAWFVGEIVGSAPLLAAGAIATAVAAGFSIALLARAVVIGIRPSPAVATPPS
jgi:nitrite reductase (NO-forming)